jgi:hypothetical protein
VVVDLLIDAGVPVRALTHRAEAAATLPANVEVVTGDLTVPESLDAGLRGAGAVFLVWTVPPATAPAVVERLASYARRVVFLSSPHQTPHPFFRQPNPMAVLHADIERLIAAAEELSPDEFRSETEGSWPRPVVDMLLAAWDATMGRPAFISSAVFDILGSAPRSFRQWVADHATAFTEGTAPSNGPSPRSGT